MRTKPNKVAPQAGADREDIAAYLKPRDPQGAQRVEAAMQDVFALLGHGKASCVLASFLPESGERNRQPCTTGGDPRRLRRRGAHS